MPSKPVVDFIFVVIELFRYLLRLRRYERKSVEVSVFRRGWVILSADFRWKRASPTNQCWCRKTRVIAVSCGVKISAVHHLVLSQCTRLTDRQTDRQTDGQTDRRTELRQQYRALHYMKSHGKKLKNRSLSHPFGHLGVTYELHLWLVGKPVVDFIFVVI